MEGRVSNKKKKKLKSACLPKRVFHTGRMKDKLSQDSYWSFTTKKEIYNFVKIEF